MPTRYLKPGICDSEAINRCTALAECLWYRLLVNVDDYGRMDARPVLVKSKCFPIREEITSAMVGELLRELSDAGLIIVYQFGDKTYLQMCKWENKPRANKSLCPAFDDACMQMYTDVQHPHTNLPVTVTVTETVTGTVTGSDATESHTLARKRMQTSAPPKGGSTLNTRIWESYSNAYLDRYKTGPVRNAKINAQVAQLAKRLGDEAPMVAGWFVGHSNSWYQQKMHSIDCLLADAEKLRTEWATGTQMTATKARQADKSGTGNAFLRLHEETKHG